MLGMGRQPWKDLMGTQMSQNYWLHHAPVSVSKRGQNVEKVVSRYFRGLWLHICMYTCVFVL